MKILVVGSGGREHALCWKIAQSPLVKEVLCAPGNAGTQSVARNVRLDVTDVAGLAGYAKKENVDLVVVGPEAPLAAGLADKLTDLGVSVFGPSKRAAQLEASKAFTKRILVENNIPTAKAESFTDYHKALEYACKNGPRLVLKADGLAAGKGVLICETAEACEEGLKQIMVERAFGRAGDRVLIEEMLVGEEVSFIALTDGKTVLPLASSQDHKRVFDNDEGKNTGGMGAHSPAPALSPPAYDAIVERVMKPVVAAMEREGAPYRGVLYAGLMMAPDGTPNVLEFNVRFGDPEAQPLLARMKSDLVPLLVAAAEGSLEGHAIAWDERPAVCVVMASGGYPDAYKKDVPIHGLDQDFGPDVCVFHAGTSKRGDQVVTSGGRVLGVTGLGATLADAIDKTYQAVGKIHFADAHYRRDISRKAAAFEAGAAAANT